MMNPQIANISTERDDLYANVLMGLHAVSQPLTMLRASFWSEGLQAMTDAELREFVQCSAFEVERACALFDLTRELVNTECLQVNVSLCDLIAILRELSERAIPEYERDGISLRVLLPSGAPPIICDRVRTYKACATALALTRRVSRAGDTVLLSATASNDHMEIVLKNAALGPVALDAEAQLALALTKLVLKKQAASLTCESDPFCVSLKFKQVQTGNGSPRG